MIVIDTSVVSELMRPLPDARVYAWILGQPSADLWTSAICQAEVYGGLATLSASRRRDLALLAADNIFGRVLKSRIAPFDEAAAKKFATIIAERRKIGRPIGFQDAAIAATVRSRRAVVATRNTRDFTDCGITVIDPWVA